MPPGPVRARAEARHQKGHSFRVAPHEQSIETLPSRAEGVRDGGSADERSVSRVERSVAPLVVRVIARLNVGGPALHVINLSKGLARRYPTVLVAGSVDEGEADLMNRAVEQGVVLHAVPELGRRVRPWQDAVAFVKLVRYLRRVRPRIVHTHTAKAGTLGRIAAVVAGVPVRVHTFHGHVFHGYFGPIATRLVLAVERLLARVTTRIVVISRRQADEVSEVYRICRREKLAEIPLGLELSRFRRELWEGAGKAFREELDARGRPVISIVGRLVPIKNHELFLEMAGRLTREGKDCVFVIVGGGPLEVSLRERAATLEIADRVRFLGWRSEVEAVYAGSDVVVLTSLNEGTPVCLIEALAMGCPVVATEVGGVADVLEEGRLGRMVPSGDVRALARAVHELLDDPGLRKELGERGERLVPERYGVERLLRDMAALYDDLLRQAPSRISSANPG